MQEKGNLSINSENFMPIIKKWLYTDKDIFIRELVSNACDAVTKLQKLSMMGEADIPAEETYEIHVVLDQDKKTLQIIDNGIGMTENAIWLMYFLISSARLHSPVQPISFPNLKEKPRTKAVRLSDISVWGSILLLW